MKTFTTYAEKKAKQILNLLQGYTKGIRLTAILILLLMGVNSAWADYTWYSGDLLYYDFSAVSGGVNWHDGSNMQYDGSGGGKVKKVEFSNQVTMKDDWVVAKTNTGGWAEIKFTNPPSANQRRFIVNSDGKNASWGYLDKYIAGDNWGGIGSWSTTTKKMTNNNNGSYTITFTSIAASAHKFKIVNYDTWTGAVGHSNNVSCVNGTLVNSDGNIQFTPYIEGDVTITYNVSTGKIVITCPGIPVTLNQQSGSGGTTSVTATYGAAMPSATMPTRNGYTFKGYYDATSGGTQYYKADGTSARTWNKTAATTLYAQWDLATYTITYDNLKGATHGNPATYTINSATITFTAPTTKPTGYTFANWTPASIAKGSTGNKTVTANWTASTSAVTLNQEEATEKGTASVTATYGSAMPAITKLPIRTGYNFGGYYTGKNGAGTQYYKADGTSATTWNLEGAQTLYAKWTAIKYNITYTNLGGATHTNAQKYTIEDAITFSEPSTRNGYTFAGWYPASIEKGSTGDKTITAQWTEKPGTTVYLKANDMWKSDGAKLAVYAWNNNTENTWLDVEYDDCTGNILRAEIPAKYDRIMFVRLKPSSANEYNGENNGYNFANAWNQTNDLKIPADNNNLYDLTKKYIYLKPNDNWKDASARFAAYFYKSSGSEYTWKDMTDADGDGYYSCEKPDGYDWVIFCRMNPATSANNWNNRWNQSANQGIPENNLFTVNDGQWGGKGEDNNKDGATGHWDNNHWDNSQWTTYTAPTFNVTINPCENGTITVVCNDQTYTSSTENVTIPKVTIHTEMNITFTPADGYILTTPLVTYADVVADNIYSICGPTIISAEFVPQGTTKTIYLRPNDDWLKDDAIFIAHAWKDGSSDLHDYLMTTKDDDYTGSYSCTIDSKYDHVLFARINPEYKTNQELSEKWMWNKTINLRITDDILDANGYRFAIGDKDGNLYDGKWEKNTPIWGLTADFSSWRAEEAIFRGYPGKVDILLHSGTHEFVLYNIKTGSYFHNNGTYTRGYSDQWWSMDVNTQDNCKLVADVDNAIYHFQMQYVTQVGEFKNQISITYPSTEVYYLAYQEGDNTKSFRKSHAIDKITEGEKQDTISFFVNVNNTPYLYLLDYADNVLAKHFITGTGGADPNNAMLPSKRNSDATLYVGAGCGVENTGVYNFILLQEGNEAQIDAAATHPYTGSYYIRTDVATGGWNAYKQAGNTMTYNSYADRTQNFSHYFCKWVENPKDGEGNPTSHINVKFCIANDYSHAISDELNGDEIIGNSGCIPADANIRFGWNSKTNKVSRAYIAGATTATKETFLHIIDAEALKSSKGTAVTDINFTDLQNWIYQVDVKATNATKIKLVADYDGKRQYFKGTEGNGENTKINLLSSTAQNEYDIRLIYNFKCNHLVAAMILNGDKEVTKDDALGADMMVIRKDQGKAEQLTFNTETKLSEVGTVYSVMTFTKTWITGTATERQRSLYWVSFPFDVKISDVFGFGEYADHWIIQYYDGAERAEKGLFSDSGTYWKYIFDTNTVLKAGQGYVLVLDLNKIAFPNNVQDVSLYFPSTKPVEKISGDLPTAAIVPEHKCNIDREWTEGETTYHHEYTDSHWNLIGVPGFADIKGFDVTAYHFMQEDASFYYNFNLANSKYTVENAATNFQAMYAYMVQFAGTINWVSKTVKGETPQPQGLAARHYSDDQPEKVVLRLELAQGEEVADRTFVQLQQEGATANFDLSLDLTKIVNIGVSNIYTLTDSLKIQTAGNVLPFEETTVAVGVDIATAGEYTFRMPDGTEGMVVELIDYETNTTTNLLLDDYIVNLPAGSNETRFALSLKPEKTATSIESTTTPSDSNIRKFIIDGKLYLQKDGMLYDAQGHIVR